MLPSSDYLGRRASATDAPRRATAGELGSPDCFDIFQRPDPVYIKPIERSVMPTALADTIKQTDRMGVRLSGAVQAQ